MHSRHLSKYDTRMALQTRIMKTIEYSLPVLTLMKGQCNYIMALILTGGLKGIGICRNLPRVVAYALLTTQGVGVTCIHTKCYVCGKDQIPNGHDQTKEYMGKKLRILLEAMKVEVEIGGHILCQDFKKFGNLATRSIWEHEIVETH